MEMDGKRADEGRKAWLKAWEGMISLSGVGWMNGGRGKRKGVVRERATQVSEQSRERREQAHTTTTSSTTHRKQESTTKKQPR